MRRSRYSRGPSLWPLVVIVAVIVVVLGFWGCYATQIKESHATITVVDKQAVASGDSGHKYLIYTKQGTFEDTDNWFHAKTTSSDLYAALLRGHTYNCKTTGVRVPMFSWYKDLISCTEVGR